MAGSQRLFCHTPRFFCAQRKSARSRPESSQAKQVPSGSLSVLLVSLRRGFSQVRRPAVLLPLPRFSRAGQAPPASLVFKVLVPVRVRPFPQLAPFPLVPCFSVVVGLLPPACPSCACRLGPRAYPWSAFAAGPEALGKARRPVARLRHRKLERQSAPDTAPDELHPVSAVGPESGRFPELHTA